LAVALPRPDDLDGLIERALAGDTTAVARLLTRVERSLASAAAVASAAAPLPRRGRAVGLFGPPGVGKSSLVAALIPAIRATGATVAVLANDPTGSESGGALLGDRLRMKSLSRDPGTFIRSVAARDPLRSLNATTLGAVELMTRIGFDYVLVEAVGAGQSDLGTRLVADTNVLVLVPGLGDDVQAMKSGAMEVADLFVVNKADLPDAQQTARMLRQAAKALVRPDGWVPPVVSTSAADGSGFEDLLAALATHAAARDDARPAVEAELAADVIADLVGYEVVRRVRRTLATGPELRARAAGVGGGGDDCIRAALALADGLLADPDGA
jgi:LAO/AO transport system kinase